MIALNWLRRSSRERDAFDGMISPLGGVLPGFPQAISRGIGALSAVVGLIVSVGLFFGVANWLAMKPSTAVSFVFLGLALLTAVDRDRSSTRRWAAVLPRVFAWVPISIGVIMLLEYATGWPVEIDSWLLRGPTSDRAFLSRMSPIGAVNCVLFGASVLGSLSTEKRASAAQHLALLGAFLAFIAFAGHLYGVSGLHELAAFHGISLLTSIVSLAISVGILFLRPDVGPMAVFMAESAGGATLRQLLLPLIFAPLLLNWAELSAERHGLIPPSVGWVIDAAISVIIAAALVGFVAVRLHHKDRTRVLTQQELSASEDRYRATFEQAAIGVGHLSLEGRFTRVNRKFCEITGYARDELLELTLRDLSDPEEWPATADGVRGLLEGKTESFNVLVRFHRQDSQLSWGQLTVFRVSTPAAMDDYLVAFIEDVTNRRNLEAQLRQAQKMEAIGQLAGGVAHDFNNILAALMLQIELTRASAQESPAFIEDLDEMMTCARRASALTRQLLQFGRREVMQARTIDLNEGVSRMVQMLGRVLGEDIRLVVNLYAEPLMTHADSGMLDQMLMNLCVNARDAMPHGGRLVIETAPKTVDASEAASMPDARPGRFVWLSVSDTGEGIARSVLPHIFEPFFTTKAVGKGTGLGLATVFGIVKQHDGWIKVYSEQGLGTTFQIFLPAVQEPLAEEPPTSARSAAPSRGGSETILLVEDDVAVRSTTRRILTRSGYNVIEAANGVEALRLWQRHGESIALLFTDLVMPEGINGRELAAQLRSLKPGLRVIFTTGYSAEAAGVDLKLPPGQGFLQKPSDVSQLLAIVRHTLDS
jgi:PAS domain S-box-containing protein